MTLSNIARIRLQNQQLSDTQMKSALEMVEWLGAVKDFAPWSGLTITDCKKGIEMIKPLLQKEVIEQ